MTTTPQQREQLPPGVRPPRDHRYEDRPTPERPLADAVQRLAERYPAASAPEPELGPVLRAHRDVHPGHPCPGQLREHDRDERVVVARCESCGFVTSFKPEDVDATVRVAGILKRSQLPTRFVDTPLPAHPGTKAAREHITVVLEKWGTAECPRPPFLVGLNGRGKTHLLTRTARALAERHETRLRYCTMKDLLDEAKAAFDLVKRDPNALTSHEVLRRAQTVPLLVLDDVPALSTDWQRETLEQLIDVRYRAELPIMGSTNVPASGHAWTEAFGPRVASRLLELTHPVEVTGPDWRAA